MWVYGARCTSSKGEMFSLKLAMLLRDTFSSARSKISSLKPWSCCFKLQWLPQCYADTVPANCLRACSTSSSLYTSPQQYYCMIIRHSCVTFLALLGVYKAPQFVEKDQKWWGKISWKLHLKLGIFYKIFNAKMLLYRDVDMQTPWM